MARIPSNSPFMNSPPKNKNGSNGSSGGKSKPITPKDVGTTSASTRPGRWHITGGGKSRSYLGK